MKTLLVALSVVLMSALHVGSEPAFPCPNAQMMGDATDADLEAMTPAAALAYCGEVLP